MIKTFGLFVKTNREVGSLNKSPSQILIAVFAVALTFLFTVAQFFTADAAAIGGEVAHLRKSTNVAGLQHDGERQDFTYATDAQQMAVAGVQLRLLQYGLLHHLDLLVQGIH